MSETNEGIDPKLNNRINFKILITIKLEGIINYVNENDYQKELNK